MKSDSLILAENEINRLKDLAEHLLSMVDKDKYCPPKMIEKDCQYECKQCWKDFKKECAINKD
jgi:hypothetical protein